MKAFLQKFSNLLGHKKLIMVLGFVGLYLLSTGTSWAIFSYLSESPSQEKEILSGLEAARSKINLELPRDSECPINGGMFTSVEKDIWEKRRPIAAIIENHVESRPPSNLSYADVVYEAVAEGGITRLLAIFYCGAAAKDLKIAPVRSARVYFIDWVAEYGDKPIFMHVGGANDYSGTGETAREARALELLEKLGWRVAKGNDFDTTYDSGYPVFWRNYERLDHPVATEHTMMASLDAAYKQAEERGFAAKDSEGKSWDENFVKWKFTEEKTQSERESTRISFGFWDNKGEYDVEWTYDATTNTYLRKNGGKEHVDLEGGKQLSAKNVVIIFVRERGPVDKNKHLLYTTIGKGGALVFSGGRVVEGTWEKSAREARTIFLDNNGGEIALARGVTWIEIIPAGKKVDY